MNRVRRSFTILGIICLVIGFMPHWQVTKKALAGGVTETKRIFTLGVPGSPFLLMEAAESTPVRVVRPDGGETFKGGNHHRTVNLGFVSWSMLSLVLGAMLIEGATGRCAKGFKFFTVRSSDGGHPPHPA
jgi:hypothetical protein